MLPRPASAFADVSGILEPASVAVIGASERPGNLGGDTVRRLVKFGFPGPVWPVNRSAAPVAGVGSFPSISAVPGVPDLAVLAVPAEALLDAVRDCVAAGVRYGIAYAGGLGEAGGAGADLQRALIALCRESGFTLCGPNCVGVACLLTRLPSDKTCDAPPAADYPIHGLSTAYPRPIHGLSTAYPREDAA